MMIEKTIRVSQGTLTYWTHALDNDLPTLVFTHGLMCDHTMFEDQFEYFEDSFQILTWDMPRHGSNKDFESFSFKDMAKYMKAILDQEKIEKVILIAQSLGGFFSQEFADQYPEMVLGIAGIGIGPFGKQYYDSMDKWFLKNTGWMSSFLLPYDLKNSIALSTTYSNKAYKQMIAMLDKYQASEITNTTQIAYDTLLKENHNIQRQHPILLISGEHDMLGKMAEYAHAWHKSEGVPLEIVVDAGHNANVDNPQAVNRYLREFINDIRLNLTVKQEEKIVS